MRAALKNPIFTNASSQVTEILNARLGSPVVPANSAKLSLGSTANSYLSNLAESSALSAVISSIGQMPHDLVNFKSSTERSEPAVMQNLAEMKSSETGISTQKVLVADAPVQMIVSLSEVQTERAGAVSSLEAMALASPTRVASEAIATSAISHEITGNRPALASIETLASNDSVGFVAKTSNAVGNQPVQVPFEPPNVMILLSSVTISPINSLANQNSGDLSVKQELVFEGITVSGNADSLDSPIAIRRFPLELFSSAADEDPSDLGMPLSMDKNSQLSDTNQAQPVAQHSIILIDLMVWQASYEIF